jgi:hypothetical protein
MSVAWGAWLGCPDNPTGIEGLDLLELVVRGLDEGTDRDGPFWWGPMGDLDQRIVEAAELSTALWLGRSRLVPALGPERLDRVLAWLAQAHEPRVWDDNWVLFPMIVATVTRGLGRPVEDRLIDTGIDRMLAWYRGDGWYTDGDGHAFDRYTGWVVHWLLMLWASIDGGRRPDVRDRVLQYAREWLTDVPAMVAADGAVPQFGRSLGYRFAFAGPTGLAEVLGVSPIDPGLARRVGRRVIGYHLEHGAIDPATDWFRIGVWDHRPEVVDGYMSAGAIAWAVKGLVPLALGPDHRYWTCAEQPLPVEVGDYELVRPTAGFLIGGRHASGETWIASALMDHPPDSPGADYRSTYGKDIYRSAFPLNESLEPDTGLVLEPGPVHRNLVRDGGVEPGRAWTRWDGPGVTELAVRHGDVWVRAAWLRPESAVRATRGGAALGVASPAAITRQGGVLTDGERWVGIRGLIGFNTAGIRVAERNLVADHAEVPVVAESAASAQRRVVVAAELARVGGPDPSDELAGITAEITDDGTVMVRFPDGAAFTLARP